jgi:hypothetical protein
MTSAEGIRFAAITAIGLTSGQAAGAQDLTAPSGQVVSLFDVVLEPENDMARFRFLAPELGPDNGARTFESVEVDFKWLCEMTVLPALVANDWHVDHVVISMSDKEVAFGATVPDVIQYFEGYRLNAGTCEWEMF